MEIKLPHQADGDSGRVRRPLEEVHDRGVRLRVTVADDAYKDRRLEDVSERGVVGARNYIKTAGKGGVTKGSERVRIQRNSPRRSLRSRSK